MITAIYLPNPFNPNTRIITRVKEDNINSIQGLSEFLGIAKAEEMDWFVNGEQKEDIMFQLPDNCYVVAFPKIEKGSHGKNIATIIVGIALIAVTGGLGGFALAGAGTAMVMGNTLGMGLVLMGAGGLLMGNQKMPSYDLSDADTSFAGGYSWSPSQIQTKQGSAIPVTFGKVRTSGMLLNKRVETVLYSLITGSNIEASNENSLCLLLSAGENVLDSIANIKINNSNINTLDNCQSEILLRNNGQLTATTLFREVREEYYSGAEIVFRESSSYSDIQFTFSERAELDDDVLFTFSFPNGAYDVDSKSGSKKTIGVNVTFSIHARLQGTTEWIYYDITIPANTFKREPYFAHALFPVTNYRYSDSPFRKGAGIYEVKISSNIASGASSLLAMKIYFYTATLSKRWTNNLYPGLSLVSLKIPASSVVSGNLPTVSWEQTRNYIYAWNPNNNSYEQKDAHNIAWMVYDLIHYCRKRYDSRRQAWVYEVEGEPADRISYADFVLWANFCAQTVNGKPRACGNLLLDSTEKLWTTIQEIASFGRGFIVQQAGIFKPIWETSASMTQIFTSGNIIQGSFSGGYLTDEERATAIEASFIDEDNGYETTTMLVQGDNYNPYDIENTTQIRVKALTNSKAVYSYCRFLLRKNKYIRRYVKFTADIDSIVAQIGDVIGVQSDVPVWGVGGRLLGATATQLVLDTEVNLEVGLTYRVIVRMSDDTLVTNTVDAVVANVKTNTLKFTNSPFSTVPSVHDVYSFGVLNSEVKKFRINSISRNGDLQANIEATEYIEAVYDDTETNIPVLTYNSANCRLSGLIATPNAQEGTITITWQPDLNTEYDGAVVMIDGVPQGFFSSEQHTYVVTQSAGEHTIKVIPVHGSEYGTESEATVTLGEQTLSPVTNVTLTTETQKQDDQTNLIFINGSFVLPVTGINALVEVREGSNGEWRTVQSSSNTSFRYGAVKPRTTYYFRITAYNSNISSEAVTSQIVSDGDLTAPSAPTVTVSAPSVPANIVQNLNLTVTVSLANPPEDMAGFNLYRGTTNVSGSSTLIGFLSAKNGKATFTDVTPTVGNYYYWAKSVDVWGNASAYSSVATHTQDTTAPSAPTITATVKQTTVNLSINLSTPPNDMAGFYLYRNANNTSSTATLLAFIPAKDGKATFTDLTPSIGNYYYWAKSADVWGNNSAFSSVASVTTQAVVADEVAATALSMPTGAILRLSAKGCTTASIALENGVIDVSGNGHHTKANGNTSIVVDDKMGQCFNFDIGMIYGDNVSYGRNLTVSFWFKRTGESGAAYTTIFNTGDTEYTYLAIRFASTGFVVQLNNNSNSSALISSISYPYPNVGELHHIAVSVDYTNKKLISQLDGVVSIRTISSAEPAFPETFSNYRIGGLSVYGNYCTRAKISDFRIYNYPLSETQMKSLYMFPDEALFAQLTADLIGANVIKAKNLVKTEAIITETAQISQAIVKDLVVTNGITIGDLNTNVNTANTNASNAVTTANTANTNASNAVTTANTANTNASNAVTTANTANTNASNAVTTANTANTNASNAVSTANSASSTASSALSTAQTASTNASNALTNAATAQTTADTATTYATKLYGTCSTAAGTAAKVVTLSGFKLFTGATISVKFTNANTVANPTLNVNSTGAKTIYANGSALTANKTWAAGDTVSFVYNGSQWEIDPTIIRLNGVMTTDYTNIQGGKIKTGIIASGSFDITTYRNNSTGAVDGTKTYDSTNQRYHGGTFSITGSAYDLDYGEIHTPYFYSNADGAGIKGHVEATSGKIGAFDLTDNNLIGTSSTPSSVKLQIKNSDATIYTTLSGSGVGIRNSGNYAYYNYDKITLTANSSQTYVLIDYEHIVLIKNSNNVFYVGSDATNLYSPCKTNSPIHISPNSSYGNYGEGIRLHPVGDGWNTIMFCGTDNAGDTGTSANTWGLISNAGNFYIAKNGNGLSGGTAWLRNYQNNWCFNTAPYVGSVGNSTQLVTRSELPTVPSISTMISANNGNHTSSVGILGKNISGLIISAGYFTTSANGTSFTVPLPYSYTTVFLALVFDTSTNNRNAIAVSVSGSTASMSNLSRSTKLYILVIGV